MNNPLLRVERTLERAITGVFARVFRSNVQPVEITAALLREADNQAQVMSRDKRLVPNEFFVELSPSDLARLEPYQATLTGDMIAKLAAHATDQAYVFPGPLTVHFESAADLGIGMYRVRSAAKVAVTTTDQRPVRRVVAAVEINGERHTLNPPTVVVGRSPEADLRINDPGVSRTHIEFDISIGRAEEGSVPVVSVRDLGSTNGMLVDGQRVTSATLTNGSMVTIGQTEMTLQLGSVTEEPDV